MTLLDLIDHSNMRFGFISADGFGAVLFTTIAITYLACNKVPAGDLAKLFHAILQLAKRRPKNDKKPTA